MVRPIPKEGRVVRLTKETLEGLLIYDSDANLAFQKMMKAPTAEPAALIPHECTPCKFDETKLKTIIKTTMEEVMAPFTGGP
jgi:hypothetical protein